jgi:alkylation response protein AidB-like acyl-CoA dehydrogenase
LRLAAHQAKTRRQFGHALGDFELVQGKIARMAAGAYAMEAMTTVTASLIDRGLEDYMLETAMLKVFTTDALWQIVNDAFQIYGGSAYFTDLPLERMLRDARINQIGEGANEVLTSFIALVGMRGPGMQLKEIWDALHHPIGHIRKAWLAGMDRAGAALHAPEVPVRSDPLHSYAHRLSRLIWYFNIAVDRTLMQHREEILDRQYLQERIAKAAMELFASACVLSRWDADLQAGILHGDQAAALFLRESSRRVGKSLAELRENDDETLTAAADAVLRHEGAA